MRNYGWDSRLCHLAIRRSGDSEKNYSVGGWVELVTISRTKEWNNERQPTLHVLCSLTYVLCSILPPRRSASAIVSTHIYQAFASSWAGEECFVLVIRYRPVRSKARAQFDPDCENNNNNKLPSPRVARHSLFQRPTISIHLPHRLAVANRIDCDSFHPPSTQLKILCSLVVKLPGN